MNVKLGDHEKEEGLEEGVSDTEGDEDMLRVGDAEQEAETKAEKEEDKVGDSEADMERVSEIVDVTLLVNIGTVVVIVCDQERESESDTDREALKVLDDCVGVIEDVGNIENVAEGDREKVGVLLEDEEKDSAQESENDGLNVNEMDRRRD